jgi:hypothetical protein
MLFSAAVSKCAYLVFVASIYQPTFLQLINEVSVFLLQYFCLCPVKVNSWYRPEVCVSHSVQSLLIVLDLPSNTFGMKAQKRWHLLIYILIPCSTVLLEKLTSSQLVEKFPTFMEPEGALPHSQQPATCPYPEPAQSSPNPHIPLPDDPS